MLKWLVRIAVGLGGLVIGGWWFRQRNRIEYPAASSLIIVPDEDVSVARAETGYLMIRWAKGKPKASIYRHDADERTLIMTVEGVNEAIITDLEPGRRYIFDVVFDDAPDMPVTVAERIIPMEGIANLRDIGGYPAADGRRVRWGRVYRAGRLSHVTEADWQYLQVLGIRTICDMRSDEELADAPDNLPAESSYTYLHRPLNEANAAWERERLMTLIFNRRKLTDTVARAYTHVMLDENATLFGDILTHIADEDNLPFLIHCTAGKDRTGVATALLLMLLGVPDDLIIADYTLSNLYYDNFRQITQKIIDRLRFAALDVDALFPLMVADERVMRTTIQHIYTHYGTIEHYLQSAAEVNVSTIQRLRDLLLV